jgi:choline-sulfatase
VASLLTGMYPNKHGAEDRPDILPDSVLMLQEVLQSANYHTLYIISNGNVAREFNFDQGNDYYEVVTPHDYTSSEGINKAFFSWFSENGKKVDQPLFAYLHTVDPHHPYTPKEPFLKFKIEDKGREGLAFRENVLRKKYREELNEEDIEYIMSLYDCEILHNDYYFQEFINFLKEKNLYDDSLIVVLGDHGEQFDEHGELYHGLSIYNEEIHVPIIIKFPNTEFRGYRPNFIMTQVDIVPTILDYIGIQIPKSIDGISVLSYLEKRTDSIDRIVMIKEKLNFEDWKGVSYVGFILDNEKHIIRYPRYDYTDIESYEVYDLEKDPNERENRNIFLSRMDLFLNKIKFHTDSVLHEFDKLTFSLNEKINLKDLPEEKIKALKALGYIR